MKDVHLTKIIQCGLFSPSPDFEDWYLTKMREVLGAEEDFMIGKKFRLAIENCMDAHKYVL